MEIKKYTVYKEEEVVALYQSVGWTNYTRNPSMLQKAFEGSLVVLGAFDGEKLVGILRAVGDGASILYIQDILVLPAYQRQKIATNLLKTLLAQYPTIYQVTLFTDNTPATTAFYRSCGFIPDSEIGCCGFMLHK